MVKQIKIADIPALCSTKCKIQNPERVERLLSEIIAAGHEKLQIVSDFDFTITKQHFADGTHMVSSFCILESCPSMPAEVVAKTRALSHKYRPIEIDATISIPDKLNVMIEWWTKSSNAYTGFPLDPKEISEITHQYSNSLRDGTHDMFNDLNALKVPVLVFSAGIGDSVQAMLQAADVLMPTVKVVSNFLRWKDGIVQGFDTEKMIHVFNKNETALEGTDYNKLVHDRTSIIVMGDSLGDAGMADGSPATSNVLKIGFLHENDEKNLPISLPIYMNTFDIVLIDDQTMDVPRAIIKQIIEYE